MNRGKGYRLLALLLIIAFISLISRTISWLILSLTIAIIVISLLAKDLKDRKNGQQLYETKSKEQKRKNKEFFIPFTFLIIGIMMTSYGLTGLFNVESIFVHFHLMVEEPFVLIASVLIGLLLSIYGLTLALKKWLS